MPTLKGVLQAFPGLPKYTCSVFGLNVSKTRTTFSIIRYTSSSMWQYQLMVNKSKKREDDEDGCDLLILFMKVTHS